MLQNLRDGAGKWFVWVIIVVIILALGLWGISYYFMDGGAQSSPVAKVNGVSIGQDELSNAYSRLQQTQPNLFTQPDASQKIKQQLLASLISEEILYQTATDQGFIVSDAQVNGLLTQIPAFQDSGQFSQARFEMILNRLMFTPAAFIHNLEKSMVINQVQNGIVASSFILPSEAASFLDQFNQTRSIGYMLIPASRFLAEVKVTAADINAYYQAHAADFQTPEQVSIAYLEITPEAATASIKPTAEELQNYYDNNVSNYTTPARWQVAHILLNVPKNASDQQVADLKAKLTTIRAEAEKGASFAALAKKYSQDIVTANNGGEMPWFVAGSLGPVFENTVSTLKPGEISAPVQTQYGVEIIKLLAVDKQQVKSYAAVANEVKQAYVSQQLQKVMADKSDALANSTFENPNSLDSAAKQLGLTVQTSPLFTRKGGTTGLTAEPAVISTAFSDDVLQQDNNSDVVTLKDGTLLVLRISKHIMAAEIPLTDVSGKITAILQQQQAEQTAKNFADKLITQIKTEQQVSEFALKNHLEWVTKPNVTRQTKGINPEVLQQAFNMPVSVSEQQLTLQGVSLSNGDYAIVGVTKMTVPPLDKNATTELAVLQQQAGNLLAATAYDAYTKMATDAATVKRYNQNVQ